jgi:hypothetical protein
MPPERDRGRAEPPPPPPGGGAFLFTIDEGPARAALKKLALQRKPTGTSDRLRLVP